jgi:6-phosphogluconolactonase (cycloisomerase 2 family)
MEIKQRMSKRFAWLLGVVGLVLIGLLVACGNIYNPSSDGLVLVGSQGSALLETFSFDLTDGRIASVFNPPETTSQLTCTLPGIPSSMVLDPVGAYLYVILTESDTCPGSTTGIQAFSVNSDGTTSAVGSPVSDPNPIMLSMDPAGKFLFVAEGINGVIDSYAIGSGATLTLVPGTYTISLPPGFQTPNFVAVAPTPTVFPAQGINGVQNAVCNDVGNNAPTSEYLYAADQSNNNVVWEFGVNTSTGALTNPPNHTSAQYFTVGSVPAGVAVDPCDRFVYASNLLSNTINAFTICNGQSTQATLLCPTTPDGSLNPVTGSPFSLTVGNGPGQLLVDPFGNYLYVLLTLSNGVLPFRISPVSGAITAGSVGVTGPEPVAMAIRGDDNWLFVTNFASATTAGLTEFTITPATGALAALPAVATDNNPWGVAVK